MSYLNSDGADLECAFRRSNSNEEIAVAGAGADAPGNELDAPGRQIRVRQGVIEAERLGMRRTIASHEHGNGDSSDSYSDHDDGPGHPVSKVNPRFLHEEATGGGGPPGHVPIPNDGYEDSLLQWIHDCIVEYLSAELDVLPQLQNVKVAQPSAYSK
ncbi:hypothetical protein EIP86_007486 [Pleurotus ostreatoroseus]|nr:hypothetical protein EIP86_007486 [Pleurotus ostreatoroseus]